MRFTPGMTELMLRDENIDAVIVGLDPHSPVTHSLADTDDEAFRMDAPDGILARLTELRKLGSKPLVAVVDGGTQFEPLRAALRARNIPTFTVCDRRYPPCHSILRPDSTLNRCEQGRGRFWPGMCFQS